APVANAVNKTCGNCAHKCGFVKIAKKSFICARPSTNSYPTGFCINELADSIQKADNAVPNATSQIDNKLTRLDKRFHPNTQIPMKVDSIKNANKPSIANDGPNTSPTKREYVDQFIPNWNSFKIPVTTPTE